MDKLVAIFTILIATIEISRAQHNIQPLHFAQVKSNTCIKSELDYFQNSIQPLANQYELINELNYNKLLFEAIKNFISTPSPNITQKCLNKMTLLYDGLTRHQLWAFKVIDSFGKPTSGILHGSTAWLGEFSECRNITEDEWHGKYCILSKSIEMKPSTSLLTLPIKLGICIPRECSNEDVAYMVNFAIELLPANFTHLLPFNLTAINSSYVTCHEPKVLNGSAIFAIIVLGILVGLVLLGTSYDIYKLFIKQQSSDKTTSYQDISVIINENIQNGEIPNNDKEVLLKKDQNEPLVFRISLCFSIYTNTIKLCKITKGDDQLQCINGIRFMSIAWVMLGHNYEFLFSFSDNPIIFLDWRKRYWFMIILNAFFSVDNFFMLRITPPYALVILFRHSLTAYIGEGPLYPKDGFETPTCGQYWWTNFLYINNLGSFSEKSCLGVSWYLANDMQFHWIAPIMLIPFALGRKFIAFGITAVLMIAHFLAIGIITANHPGAELGFLGPYAEYFQKIYIVPWCRIGPFLVGILLGYAIYRQKNTGFRIKRIKNMFLWFGVVVLLGVMLFGVYPSFSGNGPLPKWLNIAYEITSRTLWSIGLAYVIFACLTSNGGFVNSLLSLPVWVPLSRLSFATYLIHSTVYFYFNYTLEHPYHLQDLPIAYLYVGNVVFSTLAAYFVSMVFEVPIIGLEKFILGKH